VAVEVLATQIFKEEMQVGEAQERVPHQVVAPLLLVPPRRVGYYTLEVTVLVKPTLVLLLALLAVPRTLEKAAGPAEHLVV
jgi:hypothetical protein